MLLSGKKGIVLGVANQRSIAWGISDSLLKHGAQIAFSIQTERFGESLKKLLKENDHPECPIFELDVTNNEGIKEFVKDVEKEFGKIDFIVHAIAFANKEDLEGEFCQIEKENFMKSMEVSTFSFINICKAFENIINPGASLIALTYLGATQTVINYNMMGVSKAALEASIRYLAVDFGKKDIRVNAISAGPIQTLAARGIRGFSNLYKIHAKIAPTRKQTTIEHIGGTATFLVSDLSAGISSEVLFVDGGYHNVAVGGLDAYNL